MTKMTVKHIIIKLLKTSDWEKTTKVAKEKRHDAYRRTRVRLKVHFSFETMQVNLK
jgi:hypothetical protein